MNPEDFVTNVMLSQWKFRRYGITYVLPSRTTDNNYFGDHVNYPKYLRALQETFKSYRPLDKKGYLPYPDGTIPLLNYVRFINQRIRNEYEYYHKPLTNLSTSFLSKAHNKLEVDDESRTLHYFYRNALGGFMGDSKNEEGLRTKALSLTAKAATGAFGQEGLATFKRTRY